jgi:hypothetical protein
VHAHPVPKQVYQIPKAMVVSCILEHKTLQHLMLESLSRPAHIIGILTTKRSTCLSPKHTPNKVNNKLLYTTKAKYLTTHHGQKLTSYSSHGLQEMQKY